MNFQKALEFEEVEAEMMAEDIMMQEQMNQMLVKCQLFFAFDFYLSNYDETNEPLDLQDVQNTKPETDLAGFNKF